MTEFLMLCALTWFAGFAGKLVDARHEHGLNISAGAGLMLSIVAWLAFGYAMTRSSVLLTSFMGLVFFWIYKLAWDCTHHAAGLIIVLLFALNSEYRIDNGYAIAILVAHVLFHQMKNLPVSPRWQRVHTVFYRYRFDFLLIPLVYSVFVGLQGVVMCFSYGGSLSASRVFRIPRQVVTSDELP